MRRISSRSLITLEALETEISCSSYESTFEGTSLGNDCITHLMVRELMIPIYFKMLLIKSCQQKENTYKAYREFDRSKRWEISIDTCLA